MSRMRVVLVGGGLAAYWLTRELRARGHQVVVVADTETPGSSAAIALLRPSYLTLEERPLLAPALAAWELVGQQILYGARATRKGSTKDRFEEDWFAVHPELPTLNESEFHRAHAQPINHTMVWADRAEIEGDVVVWCDARGGRPGNSDAAAKVTYGSTWIHEDPSVLDPDELRVHQWAPYRVIAAASYADHARLGSSSAGSLPKALDQADRVLQEALDAGIIRSADGWYRVDGARLRRPNLLTFDQYGWRWAGFHKNGYALVPALAPSVAQRIEEWHHARRS